MTLLLFFVFLSYVFPSESVSLYLFFVLVFVFVTFLCQTRMFPDWCFPQTLSQLPLPFLSVPFPPVSLGVFMFVFDFYSVSLSLLSVSLLLGFLRGPRGLLLCCCLGFFSDVPLSFFVAVFGFICCLCLRHYLWCQMRMFSDRGSPQGVEKLGSFRAISSQHPDQVPPFTINLMEILLTIFY